MPKRLMSLSVPIIGSLALLAASAGPFERSVLAGGTGGTGGGTNVYGTDHADVQIFVDPVNGTLAASGAVGTARSETFPPSNSQIKEIGCWIDAGYTGASFTCTAIIGSQILQCSSPMNAPPSLAGTVPWGGGFAQGIATINSDSFIEFITDMAPGLPGVGGGCLGLHIDNSSKYYPKVP